jgi:glyoxylase-like metal-dependent hydrolase (beta-lactamase superfamily II)
MLGMTTRYSWTLLRAGEFRLDGGSMFGLIPRSVWSRTVPVDDKGRITVQHNCLLLERSGAAPADHPFAPKHVLIEVGTGDKLDAKSKDLFALSDRTILDALHESNCRPEDIGAVVTTHLHFDHSGALTRLCRSGEKPDWVGSASGMAGSRDDHGVKLTFPNARVYTQRREWADALANRSVMTRTYFKDHLLPVKDRVTLVESSPPFAPGFIADREDFPLGSARQRSTPLPGVPGVSVFLTPGHTWGQQSIWFEDTKGRTVVFTPDVMPTTAHLGATYNLAYDVEPYTSMTSRRWLLTEAAERDWLLVLDHEPGNPCQRVRRNEKGWFDLVPDSA